MINSLSQALQTELTDLDPDELNVLSQELRELAEEKRAQAEESKDKEEETNENEAQKPATDDHGDEFSEGVPAKATLTVKTINDNEYYYWQWREGDDIKSKYKGPTE